MTHPTSTNTPWFERAKAQKISLTWLATMTGKSYHTVYAYSVGRRSPHRDWLDKVELLIAAHDTMPGRRDGV